MREVYRQVLAWTSRRAPCAAAISLAFGLGACSTAIPLASFVSKDEDVTGSIPKTSPLSASLDAEDWRRARGALGVALDPQGNANPVSWDNPESGARGSITPVGDAYPVEDKICRAFLADIGGKAPTQQLQGRGCRDRQGEWSVSDVKPWKKA